MPGGVRAEGAMDLDELRRELDALERDLRRDRRLFLGTASMTDRLIGSGRLDRGHWSRTTAQSVRSRAARGCPPTLATSGPTATTGASA